MKWSSSFTHSAIMSVGTVANSLLGLVFYILLARSLGVEKFGYFSFLLGLGVMAAELGDLGFGSAMLRFGSAIKFTPIFSMTLIARLVVSALLFIIFFIPALVGDRLLIYSAEVGGAVLFSYLITQSLIARQKYGWYATGNILGNIARLAVIVLLIHQNLLTPLAAIQSYVIGLVVTMVIGYLLIKPKIDFSSVKSLIPEVWQYNKNVALSFGLASVSAKIDIPILYALAGPAATGIYSSAQKLISVLPQLAAAIEGVFAPKFSKQINYRKYFSEYLVISIIAGLGIILLIPLSGPIVSLFYGLKYAESIGIFQIMLLGMVFFFVAGPPAAAILYRFGKPQYHLVNSLAGLIVSAVLYFLLIPVFGAVGAAWSSVGSSAAVMIANFLWLKRFQ